MPTLRTSLSWLLVLAAGAGAAFTAAADVKDAPRNVGGCRSYPVGEPGATGSAGPGITRIPVPSRISVDPDLPVGSTLVRVEFPNTTTMALTVNCHGADHNELKTVVIPSRPYADPPKGIFKTDVEGVGLKVEIVPAHDDTEFLPAHIVFPTLWSFGDSSIWLFAPGRTFVLTLIKTGEIASGGPLIGDTLIASGRFQGSGHHFEFYRMELAGPIEIIPRKPTCKLRQELTNVPMASASLGSFDGVGTTSGETAFTIALDCAKEAGADPVPLHAVLTDQSQLGNRSNTLALTPDSEAVGVGIQVLKDGEVLSYGPDSSIGNAQNRWLAGTVLGSELLIRLSARYVQTADTVKAGTANGRATITFSYD